jgi:hypothetical protein
MATKQRNSWYVKLPGDARVRGLTETEEEALQLVRELQRFDGLPYYVEERRWR